MSDERWAYSVTEVAELLGLHRTTAYRMVARGDIPSVKLGDTIRVPRSELLALLGEGKGAKR